MKYKPIPPILNRISGKIIQSAYQVHYELGPGLLENVYETCLIYQLQKDGLKVERQVAIPVVYKEIKFDVGFRLDLLVEDLVVVELKSVEALLPVHKAQVITYLKLTNRRLGLLLNFNVPVLKKGIQRIIL